MCEKKMTATPKSPTGVSAVGYPTPHVLTCTKTARREGDCARDGQQVYGDATGAIYEEGELVLESVVFVGGTLGN